MPEVESKVVASRAIKNPIHLTKITQFQNGAVELTKKYGPKILEDAQVALRVSETKIINNDVPEMLNKLDKLSQDIKYIVESKPHRAGFIYDAAQGSKVTENSIQEALTACASEDLGICSKLERAAAWEYDFIDSFGNKWDVKKLSSESINRNGLDFKEFVLKSKNNIIKGEKILFNITNAEMKHVITLKEHINSLLTEEEILKVYFVDYNVLFK